MRLLLAVALILVAACAAINTEAQTGGDEKFLIAEKGSKETRPIAAKSLAALSQLATAGSYSALGFTSPGEVREAAVGEPFAIFNVHLDELQAYKVGSDPFTIMHGGQTFMYPLLVGQQVKSSVSIEKMNAEWQATSFGSQKVIQLLSQMRARRMATTQAGGRAWYFAVQVPALNRYFLGERIERQLRIISLWNDSALHLEAGNPVPADQVFLSMVPIAKAHKGLPQ
jgi:hypothetical protein